MNPKNIAKAFLYSRRLERLYPAISDAAVREILAANHIPPSDVEITEDGLLYLTKLNIKLRDLTKSHPLLKGYGYASILAHQCGAAFALEGQEVRVEIESLSLIVTSFEQLLIMHELYVERVYSWAMKTPVLLLDIGANVGMTSLYFASKIPGIRIESFEPSPSTFEHLKRNLGINPDVAGSIKAHNVGVFDQDCERTLYFDTASPGTSSVVSHGSESTGVKVQLKRATRIIEELHVHAPSLPMILKVDCEGSEYEIFADLVASGALKLVDGILMEWHTREGKSPSDLEAILSGNGFVVHLQGSVPPTNGIGMLYAFRLRF